MLKSYNAVISCIAAVVIVVAVLVCSFGKPNAVSQQPAQLEDIRAVAVLPFRNTTSDTDAGYALAENLADALAAQGSRQVYGPAELKSILGEEDLAAALLGDDGQIAQAFQKTGRVQAVLTGTVIAYTSSQQIENRREPVYAYVPDDQYKLAGYRTTTIMHNEGVVTVSAAMIRVADGARIIDTLGPITTSFTSSSNEFGFGPPSHDPAACLKEASQRMVKRLAWEFGNRPKEK